MQFIAFFAFVTLQVAGQDTQEALKYKEKHFCEAGETIELLQGQGVAETKRCGIDKDGKPMCVNCYKCESGARSGNACQGTTQTQADLKYKEKHFCEAGETIELLQGQGVAETKRCGIDKDGKPMCVNCYKCPSDGTSCTSGSISSRVSSTGIVVAAVIAVALLAAAFFVCKSKRDSRSDSGVKSKVAKPSRRGRVSSRRAAGGKSIRSRK